MPSAFLIVTIVSLAVAFLMALIAWRVVREERRRSAARIAALEAELMAGVEPGAFARPESPAVRVPIPMIAAAAAPESPESNDREEIVSRPVEPGPVRSPQTIVWNSGADTMASGEMFTGAQRTGPRAPRFAIVALVIALTVGGVAATILTREPDPTIKGSAAAAVADLDAQAPALELVALRHQRNGDAWTITGLVRNGAGAGAVKDLTVVAFAFDRSGGFLASGRGPLEFPNLRPGDESPFSVTVTTPANVGRYRVSFRAADGSMLKHLDRR